MNPPDGILILFEQEWEDYGLCGNVNGGPIRTGHYLSWDEYGERPVSDELHNRLESLLPDKELRKKVIREVCDYLQDESMGLGDWDLLRPDIKE